MIVLILCFLHAVFRASLCEFQTSVSASVQRLEERLVELRRSRELAAVSLEGGGGGGGGGPVLLTVPTTITLPVSQQPSGDPV